MKAKDQKGYLWSCLWWVFFFTNCVMWTLGLIVFRSTTLLVDRPTIINGFNISRSSISLACLARLEKKLQGKLILIVFLLVFKFKLSLFGSVVCANLLCMCPQVHSVSKIILFSRLQDRLRLVIGVGPEKNPDLGTPRVPILQLYLGLVC